MNQYLASEKVGGQETPLIEKIPLIPIRKKLYGPVVRRLLNRFYFLQFLIAAAGMLPVLMSASPEWKAFGLGVVWPGAGFLYAGGFYGVLLSIVSFSIFIVSLFFWWARGVILLPPVIVLMTASLSGLYIGHDTGWAWLEWFTPAGLIAFHLVLARGRQVKFQESLKEAEELNERLPSISPMLKDKPVQVRPEMTAPQITEFRRMLDLALQPVDEWAGFTHHDKWQQDSLRYQVCTPTWNLAMIQYSQLPAFHGYLNKAQENLIRKHIDRKTWDYWRYESLWGNFTYQKDPIEIDNIMLSGFLGVSLGMFESASNSSVFKEPGALTFRWDENLAFEYNHSGLCERLVENFERKNLSWFPCEPRWIYSMCNLVGFNALLFHDKRHGTSYAERVSERFYRTMDDEMLLPDGRMRVCTSAPFGFTVPSLSGLFGEAWGIRFLTSFTPERAERLWEVLKNQFITIGPDGDVKYELMDLGWDTRQPSDFSRWADINPLVLTLWAATEMGDREVIEGVSRKMDEKYGDGTAQSMTFGTTNTVRDMVNKGLPQVWRDGPLLESATYPEVIVTHAVTDGDALDLVLHPGSGAVQTKLGLGQLNPGRAYRVQGSDTEFSASLEGKAEISINLDDRKVVKIIPV